MKRNDPSRAWRTLLEAQSLVPMQSRANAAVRRVFPEADPLVQAVLDSFCVWEAGPRQAEMLLERLAELAVDSNDLRACLEREIAAALAPIDPRATERAHHLRRSLSDLAVRSPVPTSATLEHMPAQDAATLVQGIDGMVPFVATRVLLMVLDTPAVPLDQRLRAALDSIRALPASISLEEAGAWLARPEQLPGIRPSDAYELLERWADEPVPTSALSASKKPRGGKVAGAAAGSKPSTTAPPRAKKAHTKREDA